METTQMENMTYKILDKVNSPADIKNLDMDGLRELCAEIRHYMIECCSVNPGHLGSSLGAVELVVALHYVYDAPEDKIVFDVGHQAYAHKIITGRREAFRKNRMKDGISGFPKRSESEYDAFGAGHSSTSVSAALGFAEAAKLQGLDQKVIALIGDGSLTGGLALEGLNNAGASKSDILVILNDNNISIDRNIGALHEYLLKITTDPRYNQAKKRVWDRLGDGPFRRAIQRFVTTTKSHMVSDSGGDLFQSMGFRYFGPIDGNDIAQVVDTLRKLKELDGPLLLHTLTKKGKGYAPAEENQTVWHAPGQFDPETGERIKSENGVSRYQDVFGQVLVELARMNDKVVGITPAMASGCGMNLLAKEMPGRFYDVGTERRKHLVGMRGPCLQGTPDVRIIKLKEGVEALVIGKEHFARDVIIQEVAQCGRYIQFLALACQLLGAGERACEHLLTHHRGLVQIHLPVHQATGGEEVLNGIDTLRLHHQVVILHIEHLDDASRANVTLSHSRIETIAAQVVETVHIELTAHKLMQEALLILILVYAYGKIETSTQLMIHPLHQHQRNLFVMYARSDGILKHMREGSVPHIVQQDSNLHRLGLVIGNLHSFTTQRVYGFSHQEEGAQRMLKSRVLRTGIHHAREPQLLDTMQALHHGVCHHLHDQPLRNIDEPEHRVIDNLARLHQMVLKGYRTLRVLQPSLPVPCEPLRELLLRNSRSCRHR